MQLQLGVGADLYSACILLFIQLRPQNGASHIKAEPSHFKEHNLENSSQTRPEIYFRGESKSPEVDSINITQRYLHYSFTTGTTLGIGYDKGKPAYSLLLLGKILHGLCQRLHRQKPKQVPIDAEQPRTAGMSLTEPIKNKGPSYQPSPP